MAARVMCALVWRQRIGIRRRLLGHTALAALGLAVDCRRRRLVALPEEDVPVGLDGLSLS